MPMIRVLTRLPILSILICLFLIHLGAGGMLIPRAKRRFWRTRTSRHYCMTALWIFGIRYAVISPNQLTRPALLVANHISYIDVLVLAALTPSVFVSTVEILGSPLIGRLTRLAGGLFIERRKRSALNKETDEISDLLKQGHVLSVFPEGTSSDGTCLLPFKSPILVSAAKAGVPVLPIAIKYHEINNEARVESEKKDPIAFYGSTPFFSHLFTLLRDLRNARVSLTVFPAMPIALPQDRKIVAGAAHALIRKELFKN